MAEPRRLGAAPAADALDRDSQAEALLVDGLDRYFEGRYEEAIHVWTRVLFLDRSHARARAYIDRARTALAERQRRADEMLHATGQSLAAGDADTARQLLTAAVDAAGDDERAAGLRLHLERLERVRTDADARPAHPPAIVDAVPVPDPARRRARTRVALSLVGVALLGVVLASGGGLRDWLVLGRAAPALGATGAGEPPTVLSASEVALIRSRTLFARGRLSEALQTLDRVSPDSPHRAAADALRLQIQDLLLAAAVPSGSATREAVDR